MNRQSLCGLVDYTFDPDVVYDLEIFGDHDWIHVHIYTHKYLGFYITDIKTFCEDWWNYKFAFRNVPWNEKIISGIKKSIRNRRINDILE